MSSLIHIRNRRYIFLLKELIISWCWEEAGNKNLFTLDKLIFPLFERVGAGKKYSAISRFETKTLKDTHHVQASGRISGRDIYRAARESVDDSRFIRINRWSWYVYLHGHAQRPRFTTMATSRHHSRNLSKKKSKMLNSLQRFKSLIFITRTPGSQRKSF